ncbi:(2Fe-2S)-binding protein [Aureimonas fodinaquatilis]|uniref:(2Fe-2S)-binding protein n=1 Tax=Aureimonas fodinaquatilis TaxID=2565783 RepID=A0A5B0E388_9HYPH|nr:2Fe-2S iron-sulfur cluster-binding protein [Aureimonas fodinaquatilis]KAA0972615.1 (2Fe-2S)-binding protein [Aureimonas fodinaquatilis]
MTEIVFVSPDGTRYTVDAANGASAMEAAVRNDVPGIDADCGGACACATCHVYVDDAFAGALPEPEAMEEDMLDFAFDVRPNSRLSCQIRVNDAISGLVLHVPERQG